MTVWCLVSGLVLSPCVQAQEKKPAQEHHMMMMSTWKEMNAFHDVLRATYHPWQDKKDIAPLKRLADRLSATARTWAASPAPACATEPVRTAVSQISTETLALGNQVLANASDVDLGKAIAQVHEKFEVVEKACGAMKH